MSVRVLALGCALVAPAALVAGCGQSSSPPKTSSAPAATNPGGSPGVSSTATGSAPAPGGSGSPALPAATGPSSPTCQSGWQQPATGSDSYHDALRALTDAQGAGAASYRLAAVRVFSAPSPGGVGVGQAYYLDVRDPQFSARVLVVSGAGPSSVAAAPTGTHGYKAGDWTGFRGTDPPGVYPPLPGQWRGPTYDPLTANPPLLAATAAGCLDGT